MNKSMKPCGRKVPTGNINKAGTATGWTKVNGKRHIEGDNPTIKEEGMEQYSVNIGFINIRFMRRNGKCCNVARGLKQLIFTARDMDKDFCLLPLGGQYDNLCIPADVPKLEGRYSKILPS
jgi:hypothetical protein